jgi:predicted metalloprotease with PDZ domain
VRRFPLPSRTSAVSALFSSTVRAVAIVGAALAVTLPALPAEAAPPRQVAYTVSVADIPKKLYRVTATAEGVTEKEVAFAIPAWTPGWYVLTNAYKNIGEVRAADGDGKPLKVAHPDKHTWRVATNGAKTVTVTYDLLAKEQDPDAGIPVTSGKDYGFFSPYLDETNGFVPGPASLMYVVNGTAAPCRITYHVPDGWKVASANDPTPDPKTFTAPDYDTLADQPADLGKFARYDKTINGVSFSVVLVGAGESGHERLVNACWRISEAGLKVFGKAPFPRYIYQFHIVEDMPGMMGLEHLNSTVISMPTEALSATPDTLGIVAHEYVHAWNVKRVRPAALGPFDYSREVRVKDLWWMEGVTDYFAPRLLVEAGIGDEDYWLSYMTEQITQLQENDARKRVTLETASLKAWEGQSEGFDGLSYYNKGLVVGLLLDIEMRRKSANRAGLNELLLALLKQVQTTGKGLGEGEIERTAAKLTGADLGGFFKTALRSTKELPYEEILAAAGLRLDRSPIKTPDFGIDLDGLSFSQDGLRLGSVTPGGPAEKAGFKKGDLITKINGMPVAKAVGSILGFPKVGDRLLMTVKRDTGTEDLILTLGEKEMAVLSVERIANMNASQRAIFASITGAPPRQTAETR